MSTIDTIRPAQAKDAFAAGRDTRAAQPKSRAAHRLWTSFLLWMQKRESRCVLRELTDDQLRDVGLTRSEARTEVSKSFFWD
ncbi:MULTISPECIES: DUF1127 domain-containing protein [Rhizobium]|jgi:uncharacterized protein YjiS (DUF1127 family)|uniref:DUF1127 domain-containing protein n=1 Tax=Rhizobium TaxID=379 RepID=UPI00055EC594|nr:MULTISPECIES: DUF1127 domain-containing protein [Rhizobium]NKJ05783.1 uncharacterized protein YjiS (DUF1127 family) [Rhizobium sp. SG741]NTJ07247.1 DUF1127 domain-containing protein [Rhizobium lusitanum]